MFPDTRGQRGDLRLRRLVEHKGAQQLEGEKPRTGFVPKAKINDLAAIKIARLAEQRLGAVVMLARVEPELVLAHMPAGEGARRLLDVILGIVSLTEAEKLHHLARKILVRMALAIRVAIQPDKHRHVPGHPVEQLAKTAQCLTSNQVILRGHVRHAAHLAVGGGKMVVPE